MEVGRRPYKWPAKNRLHWIFSTPKQVDVKKKNLHITGDFFLATSCESQDVAIQNFHVSPIFNIGLKFTTYQEYLTW